MRSAPFNILLLSIGLVAAAPVPRDYQTEARDFFGKAVNLAYQDEFGELFDHLTDKVSPLAPGIFFPNQTQVIRTFFIDVAEKLDKGDKHFQNLEFVWTPKSLNTAIEIYTQYSNNIIARCMLLNREALEYMSTAIDYDVRAYNTKLREFTPDVVAFRAKVDALSQSAKDSLINAFPFFGKLEEIEAHVRVFDSIIFHLKGVCENVEGVKECDDILSLF